MWLALLTIGASFYFLRNGLKSDNLPVEATTSLKNTVRTAKNFDTMASDNMFKTNLLGKNYTGILPQFKENREKIRNIKKMAGSELMLNDFLNPSRMYGFNPTVKERKPLFK